MKTLVTTICAVLAVLLVIAAPSSAGLISVGETIVGTSWSQAFNESGVGNFDLVAVNMVSAGDYFESPTHSGFDVGSWALLYENNTPTTITLASASGPSTTSLTWNIQFAGDSSNSLNFDFVAFNGETIAESVNADWNGGWTMTTGTWSPSRSEVVPEPGTLMLLSLAGLSGLAMVWIRRRRLSG